MITVRFVTLLFGISSAVFLVLITIARIEGLGCLWTLLGLGSINAFIVYYLVIQAARLEVQQQAKADAYHDAATFVEALRHVA